jgi:hypothetical protein
MWGPSMGVEEALRTVLRMARVSCVAERIEPYGEQGAWGPLEAKRQVRQGAAGPAHGAAHVEAEGRGQSLPCIREVPDGQPGAQPEVDFEVSQRVGNIDRVEEAQRKLGTLNAGARR